MNENNLFKNKTIGPYCYKNLKVITLIYKTNIIITFT